MATDAPSSEAVRYSWECPLCGQSGQSLDFHTGAPKKAMTSVLSHIRTNEDELHGSSFELPDGVSKDMLQDYVNYTQIDDIDINWEFY